MKVELIYFDGCPNIADARAVLIKALVELKQPVKWVEWNKNDKNCPQKYTQYGSPTILIDEEDIIPMEVTHEGDCCRLYQNKDSTLAGVPSLEIIKKAIAEKAGNEQIASERPKWIAFLTAVPSIFIALLPKLTCPMCWPAYTALLAALGLNFANYTPYLPVIIALLLIISLISIGYKAKTRRGYNPLWLGVIASLCIISGQFIWYSQALFFTGSILLISAAIWNAWPNKKSCCQTRHTPFDQTTQENYYEHKTSN